jgi:serine/threonine protein kinase
MELADDVQRGPQIEPEHYIPRTLAHDLARQKRLPIAECQRIGIAIGSALAFLHGRGLIHRDVKPSNIVFVNGLPKLADIGLVAETSEARSYVGTEGFIPLEGPGTVQADLYSSAKCCTKSARGKTGMSIRSCRRNWVIRFAKPNCSSFTRS